MFQEHQHLLHIPTPPIHILPLPHLTLRIEISNSLLHLLLMYFHLEYLPIDLTQLRKHLVEGSALPVIPGESGLLGGFIEQYNV